jgi:membrane peptidoglycan carboxypeptidase
VKYLNTVYFGHGYYGIGAAARGYFGVAPDRLSWPRAALLAGMMRAPTATQARAYAATPLDLA